MSEYLSKELKAKYESSLLKIPGVTGVGVNGSIIIYVERLTPDLRERLPSTLEGIRVKVKETRGPFRTLAFAYPASLSERTGRYRPVVGGVSCGHPKVTAGTLTCRAIDAESGLLGTLTNNHVGALNWGNTRIGKRGDALLQPGPYDGGMDPNDRVGVLERWVNVDNQPTVNPVDASYQLQIPEQKVEDTVIDIGKVLGSIEPEVGMNVVKSGRTSGVTYSKITDVNATITVGDGRGSECVFGPICLCEPAFGNPGDSGSWVGRVDDYSTVGLLFAGSPALTAVCKGKLVEELLKVQIVPPQPPPNGNGKPTRPYALYGFWGILGVGAVLGAK